MKKKITKTVLLCIGLVGASAIATTVPTIINSSNNKHQHNQAKITTSLDTNFLLQKQISSSYNQSSEFNKFPSFKKTTTITSGKLNGVDNIKIKDIQNNDPKVIDALINSGLIKNLAPNQKLTPSDVEFTIVSKNKIKGSIKVNITIKNNKAIEKGAVKPEKLFENVELSGFKTLFGNKDTTSITNGKLNGVDTIVASLVQNNDSKVIDALINSGLIKNLAPDQTLTASDIEFTINSSDITKGSINVNITIKNNKACDNGQPQAEKVFNNIELTGFKPIPVEEQTTTITNGNLNGVNTISVNKVKDNDPKVIEALINSDLIKYLVPEQSLTSNDITFTVSHKNALKGSIKVNITIKNNKAWQNGKVQPEMTFKNIELSGFKTLFGNKDTTTISNGKLNGVDTIEVSKVKDNDQQVIEALINSGLIKNLAPNQKLTPSDVEFTINSSDATKGSINVNITIKNNKACDNGQPQAEKVFKNVELTGFKTGTTETQTTTITNGKLNGVDTIVASLVQNNDAKVIDALINSGLIKNLATDQTLTTSDVEFTVNSSDVTKGSINVNITIKNNKACDNGQPQAQMMFENVELSGFKLVPIEEQTTTISNGKLNGVNTISVNKVKDNDPKVIEALINSDLIKYLVPEQSLTSSDVQFTVLHKNVLKGSINVDITIKNNKAWQNGNVQPEMTFKNIELSGFKTLFGDKDTTTISNGRLVGVDTIIASMVNDNDPQVIDALINSGLIKNLATDQTLTASDVEFTVNSSDVTKGSINVNITIKNNKACDNGQPQAEMLFENVDLLGFKPIPVEEQTTTVSGGKLNGVNTIFANQVKDNDEQVIKALISNYCIQNTVPNKELTTNDVGFTINSFDLVSGSINVDVTILNGLAWENGQVQQEMFFPNIELLGFKKETNVKPTTIKSPAKITISNNVKASLVQNNDPELKQAIIDSGIIENIAPGQTLTVNDIKYEIINNSRVGKDGEITVNITIKNNKSINQSGATAKEQLFTNIKLTGLGITEPNKISSEKIVVVVDEKPITKDEKENDIVKVIGELPPNTNFTIDENNNATIDKYYDENGNVINGVKKFKVIFEVLPLPYGNNKIMIPAVSVTGGIVIILLIVGIIVAIVYNKKHKVEIDSVI